MDDQGALWLDAAETLRLAKSRVKELAAISPGQYLVVDLATGTKHVISTGDLEVTDKSEHAKYVNEEAR